jgi:hypothetical protein
MTIHLLADHGTPLPDQVFTWQELTPEPFSKLDDDAFTRVRVILMSGLESEAVRFSHMCARMNPHLRRELAVVRRIDHHQQTLVDWLHPADQSVLETTIGLEQAALEVTAAIAQAEPDAYQAAVYRFGVLEDLDHLYRFAALMDRVEGRDANNVLQSYTDVLAGRPTALEHRHPDDDVRAPYDKAKADIRTKLHALTTFAAEHRARDYYMTVGPMFSDALTRQLYAEIASIEEQHVTQYESLADPTESWLEKWLLHEAAEVYNYWSCAQGEVNPRIKRIWERFLDYELGQLQYVAELFKRYERRDPAEILPATLPEPLPHASHRELVRDVLRSEARLSARGVQLVPREHESSQTLAYRSQLGAEDSPSERIAADYAWRPGTELSDIASGRIGIPASLAAETVRSKP